jgi:hypothetical protein
VTYKGIMSIHTFIKIRQMIQSNCWVQVATDFIPLPSRRQHSKSPYRLWISQETKRSRVTPASNMCSDCLNVSVKSQRNCNESCCSPVSICVIGKSL